MKKKRVAIIGAGELGVQAVHYMGMMDQGDVRYTHIGWIDDTYEKGANIEGQPVLGSTDEITTLYEDKKFDACFVAIGYNHLDYKLHLIRKLKMSIPLINIIAPNVYLDQSASLGVNILIYPGVIIDKKVTLRDGCIINLGSIVSHDSEIGESSFLAPNVTIAGFSKIGNISFLGISSGVIDNVTICDNVIIGAGAIVTGNIEQSGVYCGIPAKLKHSKK